MTGRTPSQSPAAATALAARAPFVPHPWLAGPHRQTLAGALLPGKRFRLPTATRLLPLDDGDHAALHDSRPDGWRAGDPIAVVGHGLSGDHASPQVVRVAGRLFARGLRVVRMDLRGTGAADGHARGIYHSGRSEDLRAAFDDLHARHPDSPLAVVGLSLSGNIALKLSGELGDAAPPWLACVTAVCPPIDLAACAELLALRPNRVYERYFVRRLLRRAQVRLQRLPEVGPVRFPGRMHLWQFDDLYTAPQSGFAGVEDYYARASAAALVPRIRVPTLVVAAADDPFVAAEPFRALAALLPEDHPVRVHVTDAGGHLGYLGAGGGPDPDRRWVEHRVVEWTAAVARRSR